MIENYEKTLKILSDRLTEVEKTVDVVAANDNDQNFQTKFETLLNLETKTLSSFDADLDRFNSFGSQYEDQLGGKKMTKKYKESSQKLSKRAQTLKSKITKLKPTLEGKLSEVSKLEARLNTFQQWLIEMEENCQLVSKLRGSAAEKWRVHNTIKVNPILKIVPKLWVPV